MTNWKILTVQKTNAFNNDYFSVFCYFFNVLFIENLIIIDNEKLLFIITISVLNYILLF